MNYITHIYLQNNFLLNVDYFFRNDSYYYGTMFQVKLTKKKYTHFILLKKWMCI